MTSGPHRRIPLSRQLAWLGLAALIQAVVLPAAPPGFGRPDLLLAFSVATALCDGPRRALVFAFCAGLLTDLTSCGPLGPHAALDLLAARAAIYVRSVLFVHRPLFQLELALGLTTAKSFVYLTGLALACPHAFTLRATGASLQSAFVGALAVPALSLAMGGLPAPAAPSSEGEGA